jgi:hypothetical protein
MTGDSSPRARRKTNHRSVLSQHLQARSVNALPTVLTTSFLAQRVSTRFTAKVVYEPFFQGGGREIRPQRFSVGETLAKVENAAW